MTDERSSRSEILRAAAEVLASRPYETVSLGDVANRAGFSEPAVMTFFRSMHSVGEAVLTYEGQSMREAQRRASAEEQDPLKRLCLAFRLVGENLASDIVVRAGIRIAGESHHCFPERKINPFRTWERFVSSSLGEARTMGLVSPDSPTEDTAWLLTAVGLGTKDLLTFTGEWSQAPQLLERAARQVVEILRAKSAAIRP